ncbi:MAG: serine/threonine-protein phosphatase [Actinomycetota bacterium]|nr:serine/threonine-protein phosphatase [Actinomycetota bacterium]
MRRTSEGDLAWFVILAASAAVIGYAMLMWHTEVTSSALIVPMAIANLVLGPRSLPWFVVLSISVLVVAVSVEPDPDGRRVGAIVVTFLVGLIILVSSFRRSSLGVAGARGESMLVDLRDRISKQSHIPALPEQWYAEGVMRSAGGSSFAGDFMVASRAHDGRVLEVAVIDVSGKGEQAGTRSLLLSGAFGGLLGALPAGEFLPAANEYLLRQDWSEGFATAVHLSLDLESGAFEIRSAGHPPAVQLLAGSGRWATHEAEGPVLGLMEEAEFALVTGHLRVGDALLLYTDGLVETPQRDISLGIDKLVGRAERLLTHGFDLGARRILDELGSANDDQALFLLHRR